MFYLIVISTYFLGLIEAIIVHAGIADLRLSHRTFADLKINTSFFYRE